MTKVLLHVFGYNRVYSCNGAILIDSGLAIDADGAPNAYAPAGSSLPTLDYLSNAGHPGNWWGVVTSNDDGEGDPVIQEYPEPYPGYYVSSTALENPAFAFDKTGRYLDSRMVTFIALPGTPRLARLGDYAMLFNPASGDTSGALVGDVGPNYQIGECSIATAKNLSVPSNPKTGGVSAGIITVLFPGTSAGWCSDSRTIVERANDRFIEWGSVKAIKALFPEHDWR